MKKKVKCLFCNQQVEWRRNLLTYKKLDIPIYTCDEHFELGKYFVEEFKKEMEIVKKEGLWTELEKELNKAREIVSASKGTTKLGVN